MSDTIEQHHVVKFANTVMLNAQQKESRLFNTVLHEEMAKNAASFDRLGLTELVAKTTRHSDSPYNAVPHNRRWAVPTPFEGGDLIDKTDKSRMIHLMEGKYAEAFAAAAGRKIDDIIIAAISAAAIYGENVGTDTQAFDSDNQIDKGYVYPTATSVTSGLTIDKLIHAKYLLDVGEVPQEDRYLVHGAKQLQDLLSTDEISSSDYNAVKALVRGEVDTFLGFRFIESQRLAVASSVRTVLAFQKSGVGLAIASNPEVNVAKRPDKSFSWYIHMLLDMGAVRIEESKCVEIECSEA